jgi:hypothetical protein
MTGITVRFPNVDAQDLIHGTEQHRVGWRIIVKARLNIKTAWTRIFRSTVVKKLAYDSSPALFVDRLVHPTLLDDPDGTARYQVQVKMFWYAADGSVAATSLHRVDNYVEDGLDTTPVMYCTNQYVR